MSKTFGFIEVSDMMKGLKVFYMRFIVCEKATVFCSFLFVSGSWKLGVDPSRLFWGNLILNNRGMVVRNEKDKIGL